MIIKPKLIPFFIQTKAIIKKNNKEWSKVKNTWTLFFVMGIDIVLGTTLVHGISIEVSPSHCHVIIGTVSRTKYKTFCCQLQNKIKESTSIYKLIHQTTKLDWLWDQKNKEIGNVKKNPIDIVFNCRSGTVLNTITEILETDKQRKNKKKKQNLLECRERERNWIVAWSKRNKTLSFIGDQSNRERTEQNKKINDWGTEEELDWAEKRHRFCKDQNLRNSHHFWLQTGREKEKIQDEKEKEHWKANIFSSKKVQNSKIEKHLSIYTKTTRRVRKK